jgi:hypothetical protein
VKKEREGEQGVGGKGREPNTSPISYLFDVEHAEDATFFIVFLQVYIT